MMRMLESAMGSTIAGLLKDPDVIEISCNADGKIYADWFDSPSELDGAEAGIGYGDSGRVYRG